MAERLKTIQISPELAKYIDKIAVPVLRENLALNLDLREAARSVYFLGYHNGVNDGLRISENQTFENGDGI